MFVVSRLLLHQIGKLNQHRLQRYHRKVGLERQLHEMRGADQLRARADALLAYGPTLAPGATELRAPHPLREGEEIVVELDPRVPPHVQAAAMYRKARKQRDGAAGCAARITATAGERETLARLREGSPALTVDELRARLVELGVLPRPTPAAAAARVRKITRGENFRRFTSAEGHLILVGRDNRQNDRLSTTVARGSDLWLHVGRGHAGSHVLVRVPKGKTASLESLLDAATLAVHFSKARGAERCEVIYTQAKNVRKPKGLPPGKVVTSQTKSLSVRVEPERLQRLLDEGDRGGR